MIASVNPLASAAGLRVLQAGGNAVDAAIAAGAVLTVVEPLSGQLGGDAFLLIASTKETTVTAINGSGAAPLALSLERFTGGIPESGWLAATVPGIVDAWRVALERHGTMAPAALFEDAIRYAEQGFPITARLARNLRDFIRVAAAYPATMAVFFPDGRPPNEGSVFRQPDLARTLRSLAERLDDFYRGPIAAAITQASARGGGLFSSRDLAEHRTDVLQPISTTYHGWTVLEQPPISQGVILLIALNILETSQIPTEPAARVHQQVEAQQLALSERLRRVGDPRVSPVDLQQIVSKNAPARSPLGSTRAGRRRCHSSRPAIPTRRTSVLLTPTEPSSPISTACMRAVATASSRTGPGFCSTIGCAASTWSRTARTSWLLESGRCTR